LWGFRTRPSALTWALGCPLVFTYEAAKDGTALDPLLGKVGDRVVGPGRAELAAAMGTTSVVMGLVLGQDCPQVPLAEDQHPVGDLGPGREYEPFRIGVRARAAGGIFTALMPASARAVSNAPVNCPIRSRTRYRKPAARSPRSITRLRICWVVHRPSGFAVTPRMCTYRESTSITKKQYRRCRVTAQSTWKKSAASYRRGLRVQEIPPGRVGAPPR
jgi:hypothetical protein